MILSPVRAPCRVTQHFGENYEIYKRFGLAGHNGVDFTGPKKGIKVPVVSPFDGEVVTVGDEGSGGYGKYIRLYTAPDGQGRRRDVVLGHFDSSIVKKGQWVPMGDPVGIMGSTGFSTGVHLHLGVRYLDAKGNILNYNNGYFGYVDFEPFLRFWVDRPEVDGLVTYPYG